MRFAALFLLALPVAAAELSWSTFLGGTHGGETATSIAVDRSGSAYVTGETFATDSPVTPFAPQGANRGGRDGFVAKLLPDGSGLAWATYIGGSGLDRGLKIALDGASGVYVFGSTDSPDFLNSVGDHPACPCWFVAKFYRNSGALVYSRVFAGFAADMAVDRDGGVYVTGGSTGDVFVQKLDAGGNPAWRKTFGGSKDDSGTGIAVTAVGEIVITGETLSPDFPTTEGAYQRELGAGNPHGDDLFLTRLSATDAVVTSSTLLGGWGPKTGGLVALDAAGNAYVTGSAKASALPWTNDFVAKFTPAGGLLWAAQVGKDSLRFALAVDPAGRPYMAGGSYGINLRATADAIQSTPYFDVPSQFGNAVLLGLSASGDKTVYATYLGGTGSDGATAVAFDEIGNVYLAGFVNSLDFPTTPGAFQRHPGGRCFVAKIDLPAKRAVALQAVLNGASFDGGPLVPGEVVSLFGDGLGPEAGVSADLASGVLPRSLAGTQVLVDGAPAPLLYVSRGQVNAILPFGVRDMAELVVSTGAGRSNAVSLVVAEAGVGIFTRDASGGGRADVLNQDNTPNLPTNPAKRGSILQVWITGAGKTIPASSDGTLNPTATGLEQQLSVYIGNHRAEIVYAGAAPGLPAGVGQINVRIPQDAASGEAIMSAVPGTGLNSQITTVSIE